MVAFWPLSKETYGRNVNLARNGPDLQLHGVLFTGDAGPWRSSPAQFQGSDQSYATSSGHDLLITHSFSWMAAMWFDHSHDGPLLNYNGLGKNNWGPRVWLNGNHVHLGIRYGSCSNDLQHSVSLSLREWHILAAAVDYENKIMSVWADGQLKTQQLNTCDTGTTAWCEDTFYSGKGYVL